MPRPRVRDGTIVIYPDVACAWSTVAIVRLPRAREELGLTEAVQAAKQQSTAAAEELDLALRLAFFRDSRCISMRHEIVAVAEVCEGVDPVVFEDLMRRAASTVAGAG